MDLQQFGYFSLEKMLMLLMKNIKKSLPTLVKAFCWAWNRQAMVYKLAFVLVSKNQPC
jgi:hypothetical protein